MKAKMKINLEKPETMQKNKNTKDSGKKMKVIG